MDQNKTEISISKRECQAINILYDLLKRSNYIEEYENRFGMTGPAKEELDSMRAEFHFVECYFSFVQGKFQVLESSIKASEGKDACLPAGEKLIMSVGENEKLCLFNFYYRTKVGLEGQVFDPNSEGQKLEAEMIKLSLVLFGEFIKRNKLESMKA